MSLDEFMRGWETGRADVAGSVFTVLHDAKYETHRDTMRAIEAIVKPLVEAWLEGEPVLVDGEEEAPHATV